MTITNIPQAQQPADELILFIERDWQNRSMPLACYKRRHRSLPSIT
ncbi:MAG: hypothetical protein HOM74_04110 [Proteobacteria bacterium]|nr:hypothetical protein [Pseudomonadota bacterium]